MRKKEIMEMILSTEVGQDLRIIANDKAEELRFRNNIRRAEKFGYKCVFIKLYDNTYYFEKLKEGQKDLLRADSVRHPR